MREGGEKRRSPRDRRRSKGTKKKKGGHLHVIREDTTGPENTYLRRRPDAHVRRKGKRGACSVLGGGVSFLLVEVKSHGGTGTEEKESFSVSILLICSTALQSPSVPLHCFLKVFV